MEAATQNVEALDPLDNRGNAGLMLPSGLESMKPGGKRGLQCDRLVWGLCAWTFRSVRNVLSMVRFCVLFFSAYLALSPKLETISGSRSITTSCALVENEILRTSSPLSMKFQIYF